MKNIIIHNIELSRAGIGGMSGGETCLIELIKSFNRHNEENLKVKNIIYTPDNGVETYKHFFNASSDSISFVKIGEYKIEEKFGILFSYLYKIISSIFYIKRFDRSANNIIISHSNFWPDLIYAYFLKKKNPEAKWFAFNHLLSPSLIKGYKYQFIKKYKIPSLVSVYHWLSQEVFFSLSKQADYLLTVNSLYLEFFKKYNKNVIILKLSSDVYQYFAELKKIEFENKKYDACFIGRFHEQKGIFELIDIVKRIRLNNDLSNFKCVVIGDYKNKIGKKLIKKIEDNELCENFEFVGIKTGLEKYKILNDSKMLLFPSYYESFGVVYVEAISLGIPVFEYDLPIYNDHRLGVVKVPYLNNDIFSKKIVDLLGDKKGYDRISSEGMTYSDSFSWEKTANEIFNKF